MSNSQWNDDQAKGEAIQNSWYELRKKILAELLAKFGVNQCKIGMCGWLPDGTPAFHTLGDHDSWVKR